MIYLRLLTSYWSSFLLGKVIWFPLTLIFLILSDFVSIKLLFNWGSLPSCSIKLYGWNWSIRNIPYYQGQIVSKADVHSGYFILRRLCNWPLKFCGLWVHFFTSLRNNADFSTTLPTQPRIQHVTTRRQALSATIVRLLEHIIFVCPIHIWRQPQWLRPRQLQQGFQIWIESGWEIAKHLPHTPNTLFELEAAFLDKISRCP